MKIEYRMVIAVVVAAGVVMAISNMNSNALADPAHCDRPGWPSCYKVGYEDGVGNSGSCPSRHSLEFCRGWNDATHSNNNLNGGPPTQQLPAPPAQQPGGDYGSCVCIHNVLQGPECWANAVKCSDMTEYIKIHNNCQCIGNIETGLGCPVLGQPCGFALPRSIRYIKGQAA